MNIPLSEPPPHGAGSCRRGLNLSTEYTVPEEVKTVSFEICAHELGSIIEGRDVKNLKIHGGVEGITNKLNTSIDDGISTSEHLLNQRKEIYGVNKFTESPTRGFWVFVLEAFQDTTLMIPVVYALVSLVVGIVMESWHKGEQDGIGIVASILLIVFVTATITKDARLTLSAYAQRSRANDMLTLFVSFQFSIHGEPDRPTKIKDQSVKIKKTFDRYPTERISGKGSKTQLNEAYEKKTRTNRTSMTREPDPRPVQIELKQVPLLHQIPNHRKSRTRSNCLNRETLYSIHRLNKIIPRRRRQHRFSGEEESQLRQPRPCDAGDINTKVEPERGGSLRRRKLHAPTERGQNLPIIQDGASVSVIIDPPNGRFYRQPNAVDGDTLDDDVIKRGRQRVSDKRRVTEQLPRNDVGVVEKTVREGVTKFASKLGSKRNGPAAQSHYALRAVEAGACYTGARGFKPTPEFQVFNFTMFVGAGVERRRFLGEEARCCGPIRIGIFVAAGCVEFGAVVTVCGCGVRDESTRRVVAVVGGEASGMSGQECGSGSLGGAVTAGGAFHPDKVAAGVDYQEEALRRGSDAEVRKVLPGAHGGAGGERGLRRSTEAGDAVEVGGEDVGDVEDLRYSVDECVRVRMVKKKTKKRKEWSEEYIVE
ncbi:hypothetical protein V8G54_016607 [Vigna mungo]|uniref:Cation-transporting P-type ATPase N-terminal domain-containing protein n=1 Tax=Vigna mungo TaxID=3915 RepID=A0AAQ3RZI0_VIGMU